MNSNPIPYFVITIAFVVLTLWAVRSILRNNKRLRMTIVGRIKKGDELPFFPRYCASRSVICYVITFIMVSVVFFGHVLPFQFLLFGFGAVLLFFLYASRLTRGWLKYDPGRFVNKLFVASLLIRMAYVVFVYFYYIEMTGKPHMFHAGDELWYQEIGTLWREEGFEAFVEYVLSGAEFSDSGYCWWLGIIYKIFGIHVLSARLIKCFIDSFSCVLIYSLAKRNFGEQTARIAAVFYMLMPNTWYYCGITLKETEMNFIGIVFVERADLAMRSSRIKIKDFFVPLLAVAIMLTFRTALAAVMVAALVASFILSSKKQMQTWKKIVFSMIFGAWMFMTVGVEMRQEAEQLWYGKTDNQEVGYAYRSSIDGGNSFARYAGATMFAPFIFTIPFPTMVNVETQENQMMMNGANFIKNVLSIFVIFALAVLLIRREWRQHVLPLAVMCGYLVVLIFSNFAHSERFHFPVLGFELMFAAYGVSQMTNKHKRWFNIWLVLLCVADIVWTMIKLKGRGVI